MTTISLSQAAMQQLLDPCTFSWGPIQRDFMIGKFRWVSCATPGPDALAQLAAARGKGYRVERLAHGRIIVSTPR